MPTLLTVEVYTYGSGDFIAQIFTGVALMLSGNAIQDLIKVILVVGLMVAILHPVTSWLTRGQAPSNSGGEGIIAMLRQVLLAGLVMYAFILPKANVAIIDRIDPNQSTVVGNVPMLQAVVAYGASTIGDTIGKEMETAFSLPDSMTFRNGGLGLGIKYIDTVFTIQPPSASTYNNGASSNGALVRQSLYDYFSECVFPNYTSTDGGMGDRTVSLNALANSTNILQTLQTYHNLYDSSQIITGANSNGQATCTTAPADINTAWNEIYPEWVKEIETKVSNGASTNVNTVGTGIMTNEIMSRYFPGPLSTQEKLKNIAVANLMREATRNYAARFGDAGSAAASLSTSSAVSSWQTTARMFGAIVHTMRNVFEGLIYGLACLLPVAVAVVGLSALATYFKIVLWLQLWVPFYVLLNLFGDMEMTRALQSLSMQTNSPGDGISVKMFEDVAEKAQLSLAYLGSLSFTVPMFAWGLLKGGEYAMSSAVSAMTSGGGAAAQASSIGGQVGGLGNVNVGNKSIDSHSFKSSTSAGSSYAYQTGIQGGMRSGMEVFSRTGLDYGQQAVASNFMQKITGTQAIDAAGGYTGALGVTNTKAQMDVGQAKANLELANKVVGGPDAVQDWSKLSVIAGGSGALANQLTNVSREAGIDVQGAANRISEASGNASAVQFFKTEEFMKTLVEKGHSLSTIGGIQSRSESARVNADAQFSQAYHNMNALTDTQKQMFTNWGVRTALGNNNDNVENFYNRAGYMNTAEQTGKMDAAQNYVDRHGMSFVDFYTGMNSHGKLFNVDMAWGQNGGTLFTAGRTGNSTLHDDTHVTNTGTFYHSRNGSLVESGDRTVVNNNVLEDNYGKSVNLGNVGDQAGILKDSHSIKESLLSSVGGNESKLWTDRNVNTAALSKIVKSLGIVGDNVSGTSSSAGVNANAGLSVGFGLNRSRTTNTYKNPDGTTGTTGTGTGQDSSVIKNVAGWLLKGGADAGVGASVGATATDAARYNKVLADVQRQNTAIFNNSNMTPSQKTAALASAVLNARNEIAAAGEGTKTGRVANRVGNEIKETVDLVKGAVR